MELDDIKAAGFTGRSGHPGLYDVLRHVCRLISPRTYLEIGMYDGASVVTVITHSPHLQKIVGCDIFGNDWRNWQGGTSAEAPAHITQAIRKAGYFKELEVLVGDSAKTIPNLREKFDLILIDGDHAAEPARTDFLNCWPLLNDRGILVFDDCRFASVESVMKEIHNRGMSHIITVDDEWHDATSAFMRGDLWTYKHAV